MLIYLFKLFFDNSLRYTYIFMLINIELDKAYKRLKNGLDRRVLINNINIIHGKYCTDFRQL